MKTEEEIIAEITRLMLISASRYAFADAIRVWLRTPESCGATPAELHDVDVFCEILKKIDPPQLSHQAEAAAERRAMGITE